MAIRDIASNLQPRSAFNANIASSTTTVGSTIDTQGFDGGVVFEFHVPTFTDGSHAVQLFEGDASDMSDESAVSSNNLIGSLPTLTAATAAGAVLNKVGVFGNKRYLRVKIVSTGVTTGARVVGIVNQKGDLAPVATS